MQHLEGGLDADGKPVAWLHRTVFPSIASTFTADTVYGSVGEPSQGAVDVPFDVPNIDADISAGTAARPATQLPKQPLGCKMA
ncbi:MAG TPA: hypothetical protein VKI44_01945 [Acetobacteraceae bacterium]|nr:hypothetical protein [Acetobacteraceae bacterium]